MNKVKVGIVGLGRLGIQHAENLAFRIPNCELKAICGLNTEQLAELSDKWNIPYTYTSYEEMLQNSELDAIFIASPSNFHCDQIQQALEAGYHVFSEKPLGLYLEEVEKIETIINRHQDKVFMLGFMRRYDDSYAYAKKQIEQGAIGEPVMVRCYGFDPTEGLESFLKFAQKNYSGGIFLDMAVHDFDLARWYLGAEAEQVWAIGGAYSVPAFTELNDAETGAALVKFSNGTMGLFAAGRNSRHGYHIETEIIGTKGSLRIGTVPEKNAVTIFNDAGALKECVSNFNERFAQAYLSEVEEFIHCIQTGSKPAITAKDGVQASLLGYACKESFETGELVHVKAYSSTK
ncbi:Gfo/Idh/MocA family oxidoreductase [Priestia flexa]|uniref:Gfo/Idh/MocA family oxidoreductase n=2 Tax=Priestia TaxID=2800373 RepID=A0A1N6RE06_9BACI|nr:Gfo/Idh/MocA family oxidoreductase [Priestia flexa]MBN8250898.1 Gfo/Idh/MocA family oxidoreductase [Priestia flexa]MBN8433116.1 Gfo/Idh/MocA family oxidoreductase [Priestia flexa]MBY6086015.1 Gfo/Idh/MocA family oxidoreductase [Priestia flexa]MCA0965642.1 Gfo/Idh/MocA family oxidoreductase [Priestia flexa]MCA1202225.1 Gfo/Idh/MocA family oxidoreductase [Priestia flexa]